MGKEPQSAAGHPRNENHRVVAGKLLSVVSGNVLVPDNVPVADNVLLVGEPGQGSISRNLQNIRFMKIKQEMKI